jgi:putative oxidoreductase
MKWAVLIVRTLLGAAFLVYGVNYFLNFLEVPPPPSGPASDFLGVLIPSGYLTVVKVLEAAGGLLLITGRWAPVGITLVTPVAVNIMLYEVLLLGQPGIGVALVAMCAFLVVGYWKHFRGVFASTECGGCC